MVPTPVLVKKAGMPAPPARSFSASVPWGVNSSSSSPADRKSTRLNSSHLVISYAVFCLKKKKTTQTPPRHCPNHYQSSSPPNFSIFSEIPNYHHSECTLPSNHMSSDQAMITHTLSHLTS